MFSMSKIQIKSVITGYHVYRQKPDIGIMCCVIQEPNAFDNNCLVVKLHGDIIGHVPAKPISLKTALNEIPDLSKSIEVKCEIIGTPMAAFIPWVNNLNHPGAVIPCRYSLEITSLMKSQVHEVLEFCFGKELTVDLIDCFYVFTPPVSPLKKYPDSPDWKSMTP